MIGAMAPSFITMRNTMSDDLPTNDFICLVIFVVISAVLQAFGVSSWKYIGRYGGILTLVCFTTIVSVTCAEAGGVGP